MKFYIIVPSYSKEVGYKKFTFGPYKTRSNALEISRELGGEVAKLDADSLEEAIEMLNKRRRNRVSIKQLGSVDTEILEELWKRDEDLYHALWHKGISSRQLVNALKQEDPVLYQEIMSEWG